MDNQLLKIQIFRRTGSFRYLFLILLNSLLSACLYSQTSVTFSYTGGIQTWTVPAGVTSINIESYGAQGGSGNAGGGGPAGGVGGNGSKATGTLSVTPGQILNIFVGGAGMTPTGGFNGGGNGGSTNAGGGGGASDIRYPGTSASERLIVGAGGGGGGRGGCEGTTPVGGNGGTGDGNGVKGTDAPTSGGVAGGGFPGVGSVGGAAGVGCGGFLGSPGSSSSNENGAAGGAGQSCCCFTFPSVPGGGGGGGGFQGGGGGGGGSAGTTGCSGNDKGGGGGGAGGSSYTGGVSSGSIMAGVQSGNGQVKITYFDCTMGPDFTYCPSDIIDFAVTGVCGKVITYATPTATGDCPPITVTQIDGTGFTSGQIFPVGTTTQTWLATDANGNTAECSFTITIQDDQYPIITGCPNDVTINTDPGECSTTHTWTAPTASDNCPGVGMTATHAPGSTFNKGVTTVTYEATDASGNVTICEFDVTVIDTEMPTITGCPENITVNADPEVCNALVEWDEPIADDNCMVSSFGRVPAGSTFNVGTTVVTYTATDMSGNTKTCSFSVTVIDNQKPVVICPMNAMRNTNAGVCKYTISGAEFNANISDNCGIAPPNTWNLSGATMGSGNTTLAGVMLNKGVTTIQWNATDVNGNTNSCSFTVEVKDVELPTITCPPNITITTMAGQCAVTGLVLGTPTVSDNCGMTTVTNNGLSSYPVGVTTVTWTVTDMSGNTKTCNQTVMVVAYSCGVPTQVFHTDTTATTAKVKWKVGKCATSYELRIRMQVSAGVWGAWSAFVPSSGPHGPPQWTHMFMGLTPGKFYNYQVRSVCGNKFSGLVNGWFNTLPPPFTESQDRISEEDKNVKTQENELPGNVYFVPNPANEYTTVMIEGFEQNPKTVTMFDLYGKLVFSVKVEADQNLLELDLGQLNVHTGMYLLQVSNGSKRKIGQLMIER